MDRLTTKKDVYKMGMYELAHNCCYVQDGNARYRDFTINQDCRELTRSLMLKAGIWDEDDTEMVNDDIFDDTMMEYLQYDLKDTRGLIAILYRNMWAMAELRETLKQYEDAEQEGTLYKLPCKINDKVYIFIDILDKIYEGVCVGFETCNNRPEKGLTAKIYFKNLEPEQLSNYTWETLDSFGKTIFLRQQDAEKAQAAYNASKN